MIKLFAPRNRITIHSEFDHLLHGSVVTDLEKAIADYVGAKYAVAVSSATAGLFLSLKFVPPGESEQVQIPSIIPPVVPNVLINSDIKFGWNANTYWVGSSYPLYINKNFTIVDSAQSLNPGQFENTQVEGDNTLMVFSFYPTKPLGGVDGGMVVSNNEGIIDWIRTAARNGTKGIESSWERDLVFPGWKMYMNSLQATLILDRFKTSYEKERARIKEIRNRYDEAFDKSSISYHLYRLRLDSNYKSPKNIQTGWHYKPCHLNPVYKDIPCRFDKQNNVLEESLKVSIPFHHKLTDDEVEEVIKYFKQYRTENA